MRKKDAQSRVDIALNTFHVELLASKTIDALAVKIDDIALLKQVGELCQWSFRKGFESAMDIASELVDQAQEAKQETARKKRPFDVH